MIRSCFSKKGQITVWREDGCKAKAERPVLDTVAKVQWEVEPWTKAMVGKMDKDYVQEVREIGSNRAAG